MSDKPLLDNFFSLASAFCLKPWVMKKAVEPTTAPKASSEFCFKANQTIMASSTETTAKNQTPLVEKKRSPGIPKFFGSRNSQLKNKKIKNTPPPINKVGVDDSIASLTDGLLEKVATSEPIGPSFGVTAQTIIQGSNPLITKTANKNPQSKNQRRPFLPMVESTSALTMALSMLEIVSNRQRPTMTIKMENKLISHNANLRIVREYYELFNEKFVSRYL